MASVHGSPTVDFETIFEQTPGLYLVLDPDLKIVAVSDAYLAATMTVRREIIGRGIFEVFPDNPDDEGATGESNLGASLHRVVERLLPDAMAVQKYDIRKPPSEGGGFEVRYWSPANEPVVDSHGELRYIVHTVEDVTEYVALREHGERVEGEAEAANERTERMEAEILRRSADLQRTNAALRAANEAKNQFLSRMSHELRTPLTAIGGFAELLALDELSEEQRQSASTILRASRHLLRLVDDVLDIAQIEAGALSISLEPVLVADLFGGALELVRPLAERRRINLRVQPPPADLYALADNQRLKQAVINLIVNAIKYNRRDGEVQVTVEHSDSGRIRIDVVDTGRGIAADAMPKLFIPFERLDAAALGIDGSGLGLALSKTMIEGMGGRIGAESELGVGSRFWIEVRRAQAPAPVELGDADSPALETRQYATTCRLLYIEDTLTNIRFVEAVLRRRPSVELLPAMMGSLGLELAREHLPDLILLDMHLPDMNGDEVLEALRQDSATREIPVIVLTADATEGSHTPGIDELADGLVTKPIGVEALLQLIDRFAPSSLPSSGA